MNMLRPVVPGLLLAISLSAQAQTIRPGSPQLQVVDMNGTVVGPVIGAYSNDTAEVLVQIDGIPAPVTVNVAGEAFGEDHLYVYESNDCTGTAYAVARLIWGGGGKVVSNTAFNGLQAFISDGSPTQTISQQSFENRSQKGVSVSPCQATAAVLVDVFSGPTALPFNLGFTGPFSVRPVALVGTAFQVNTISVTGQFLLSALMVVLAFVMHRRGWRLARVRK